MIKKYALPQVITLLVFLLSFQLALAAIPPTLNYQGHLTDSSGVPVDGPVDMQFAIYDVATGGTAPLWSVSRSVIVDQGVFSVELGSSTAPLPPGLFESPLWMGLTIGTDAQMTPLRPISSVGFSFKAGDADTLEGVHASTLDQSEHVIDTANPHSVTAAQTGAISSAELTLHTGNVSAHHTKTTNFTELTDQANDTQLPASITRDAELLTHTGIVSAHHIKTSSFTELSDQAVDAQLPAAIARDTEILPTVLADDGSGSTLDADLFDGLDSTAFMSSGSDNWVNTTGDTMTGNLNVLANIGIGTVTPGYRLDVRGGGGSYLGYFYNDNNGSGNAYGLYVGGDAYDTGTSWGYGGIFFGYGGSTSGGAYGTQNFARAYGSSTAYGVYSNATVGSTTGREWAFYGVGDGYISGDVGIGTSTPGSRLSISGGATVGSAYVADSLGDGNLAISGNVGIGITTPTHDLEVIGSVPGFLGYFENDNNASGGAFGIYASGDAYDTVTFSGRGGNFYGIGGSTSGTAYGTANYANAFGSSDAYGVYSVATGGTTTGHEYAFYGLGDGYFSGNVGIGTATPTYQLHIKDGSYGPLGYFHNDNNSSGNTHGISVTADAYDTGTDNGQGGTFNAYGGNTSGDAFAIGTRAFAYGTSTAYGVYSNATGGSTAGDEYAFYGVGDGYFSGTLTKGGGAFKIDHPLDPENKYLYHSFVESPDMKNVYDGVVILDGSGEITVTMPNWFNALNKDYRYQLTPMGGPGPNLYIAEKIKNNSFKIAGGQAGMEVSWQVTGIRQDAFANANRIPVEEDKQGKEVGIYLHPEAHGQPAERSLAEVHAAEMRHKIHE